MDVEPEVSVVIPAFNAEDYIEAAVVSACAQSLSNIEIIVVDDASTDRTLEILFGLAAADHRIRVEQMHVNSGPGASRNRGIAVARGAWVALLDADDRFERNRLEVLLSLASLQDADVVADNVALHVDGRDSLHRIIPEGHMPVPKYLSFQEFIEGAVQDLKAPKRVNYVFMHPIFRLSFLLAHQIGYDERTRNGEDLLLYIDCFLAGAKWFVTPEAMYLYSIREGSLTDTMSVDDSRHIVYRMRSLLRDPRVSNDRGLTSSIRRHWRSMALAYYFWTFKAAFSGADYRRVVRTLFCDKISAAFIARELVVRAPGFCKKLVSRQA